ncbi:MAG: hypothetical protein WC959_08410 [Kiritimatiellales bacterium]
MNQKSPSGHLLLQSTPNYKIRCFMQKAIALQQSFLFHTRFAEPVEEKIYG